MASSPPPVILLLGHGEPVPGLMGRFVRATAQRSKSQYSPIRFTADRPCVWAVPEIKTAESITSAAISAHRKL